MTEVTYCIFSLSEDDPTFTDKTLDEVKDWLIVDKKSSPYYFHEKKPRNVFANSRLLFSFKATLFGKAEAKKDIEEVPPEQQEIMERKNRYVYTHSIVLKRQTIALFEFEVSKSQIKEILGINCDRMYKYLEKKQYNKILKMGGLRPEI